MARPRRRPTGLQLFDLDVAESIGLSLLAVMLDGDVTIGIRLVL